LKGRGGRRRRRLTKIIDLLPSANQLKLNEKEKEKEKKKKKKKKKKRKRKRKRKRKKIKRKNVFFIRQST